MTVDDAASFAGVTASKVSAVQLTGDQKINVRNCVCCDAPHSQLDARPLQAIQSHGFTHCYTCPTTGDPALLALYNHDGSLVEVPPAVLRALIAASARGRMLVAVFASDGDVVHLFRSTTNWPTAQFPHAIKMLADDIDREIGPPAPTERPQPEQRPAPLVNLFGDGPQQMPSRGTP